MATYTKRRRVHLGLVSFNFVKHTPIPLTGWHFSSWSIHLGLWTWNSRAHKNTVDVPEIGGHVTL